jgi:hypothetical protein
MEAEIQEYLFPLMLPELQAVDFIELACLTIKRAGTDEGRQALDDMLTRLAL